MRGVLYLLMPALLVAGCKPATAEPTPSTRPTTMPTDFPTPGPDGKVRLTDAEWRARLTAEQYRILRSKGTEPPGSCGLLDVKEPGTWHCAGCNLPLFVTEHKFDSGTGWPSFFKPIRDDAIATEIDRSYGMIRTEVLCARCDGHLGHVFEDGPKPTGLRYCINGVAVRFVPEHR
jgi:peptide-methionine (R)-S-oxide reductase